MPFFTFVELNVILLKNHIDILKTNAYFIEQNVRERVCVCARVLVPAKLLLLHVVMPMVIPEVISMVILRIALGNIIKD